MPANTGIGLEPARTDTEARMAYYREGRALALETISTQR